MGEGEQLLRDILREPGDDGLRLIYADWLEENGEAEQAELIRLHDALAHAPADTGGHAGLARRAAELEQRLVQERLVPLGGPGSSWTVERGLVTQAALETGPFLARWEEVIARTQVPRIDLFAGPPTEGAGLDLAGLAACAGLGRVRSLELRGRYLGPDGLAPLLRSPHLGGLRRLDLSSNALGAEGAGRIGLCPGLAGLEELNLSGNLIGDEGLHGLLGGGALRSLRVLAVAGNSLTDDGTRALGRPEARSVAVLDLARNALTARGVRALCEAGVLGRLTALDLGDNFLGDDALELIARHIDPGRMAAVGLSGNPLSRRALDDWAGYIPGALA